MLTSLGNLFENFSKYLVESFFLTRQYKKIKKKNVNHIKLFLFFLLLFNNKKEN